MNCGLGIFLYLECYGPDPGLGSWVASVSEIISNNVFLSIRCLVSIVIAKALDNLSACPLWQVLPVIYT